MTKKLKEYWGFPVKLPNIKKKWVLLEIILSHGNFWVKIASVSLGRWQCW